MKKLWTLLLTLVFAVGLISPVAITTTYAANGAVMTVGNKAFYSHEEGWREAVKRARIGMGAHVQLHADWIAENGAFVVKDGDGIECGTYDGSLYINVDNITLDLNGHVIDRNLADGEEGRVITVYWSNFTIDDTSAEKTGKITGGHLTGSDYGAGIYVVSEANLTLNGGSICGNTAEYAAGIYVSNSTFTMNGGSISKNKAAADATFGAGVYINKGTFTMNGGSVSENESVDKGVFQARAYGAGVYLAGADSEFVMNGGEISNNTARRDSDAEISLTVYCQGGGVYADANSRVTMNGGSITRNVANGGCGVYLGKNATMNLTGGSIENNGTSSVTDKYGFHGGGYGGGVYVDGGALHMSGGSVNNNVSPHGGGICSKNDSASKVLITGGSLTGNTALQMGGAIYHGATEKLIITDCEITDNESVGFYAGGVYVAGSADVFIGGTTNIINNTNHDTNPAFTTSNLFLRNGESKLYNALGQAENVPEKPLEAGVKIGVELHNDYFTADKYFIQKDSGFTKENTASFSSDCIDKKLYVEEEVTGSGNLYSLRLENVEIDTEKYKVAKITTNDKTTLYYDFNRAWEDALVLSAKSPATLTLLTDWVCGYDGHFTDVIMDSEEYPGYDCGSLNLRDDKIDLTVDLNGHKIDRNRKTGTDVGQIFTIEAGTLRIKDSVGGGKITGADDIHDTLKKRFGGAIDVTGGNLYMEGGEISGNYTDDSGSGIFWNSNGILCITGGKIVNNYAYHQRHQGFGGGVYLYDKGDVYIGGDVVIDDNYTSEGKESNIHLDDNDVVLNHAVGQAAGIPNAPLKDGAHIGIYAEDKEEMFTGDNSCFREGDFRYFYSDDERYFIRSVYDATSTTNAHQLYVNSWGHEDSRYPRVKTVSVKDSNLLEDAVLDYDTQTITLTAHNTRRNFFQHASLADLIECTYDKDTYYLYEMDYMRDLRTLQEYKIMSDNGTYVICKVNVVPEGGAWAEDQESLENPYKMTVAIGGSAKGFTDFGEGWAYAVKQVHPVTITLFDGWNANGKFEYAKGTHNGRLYLDEDYMDITIDLNGNTLSRGLTNAVSDGQVFLIESGAKLTITDNSDRGFGKISGGYNDGDGGAFYVDYGKLYINGGEISGNKATNGAAIYGTNEDDTFIYINGGKIKGNTATNKGGAIFMYNGYLYVDGGEISGNTAASGGGIYWESRDKLCLTGGSIQANTATEGGGVYATDWGDMYIGGTIIVRDNIKTGTTNKNNFFISDTDAYLNNAAGQPEVPNKPLTEGADVRISTNDVDFCMSDSDSRFTMNSINYLDSDASPYVIRPVYHAADGNHAYKLYYNHYYNSGITIPGAKSMENKSAYVNNLYFSPDSQYARLSIDIAHKDDGTLKSIALSELANVTFDQNGTELVGFHEKRDFTTKQEYMVLGSDGTYAVLTVNIEWVCSQHKDADENHICDICESYILTDFAIVSYDAQTIDAIVITPEAGEYTLAFADYENEELKNVSIVKFDSKVGLNRVSQVKNYFTLGSGDKIMLWRDTLNCEPLCQSYTVK